MSGIMSSNYIINITSGYNIIIPLVIFHYTTNNEKPEKFRETEILWK